MSLNFKEITSRDNSLIKHISELQNSSKKRQKSDLFVLEGLRICRDAFENSIVFDKLIVSHSALEKLESDLFKLSQKSNECILLPDSLFNKISTTETPQGIIALAKKPELNYKINPQGRYIALENLQDPSNLGAVARSCEALGADGIFLSKGCCDPYAPKSLRASMGTLLRIPVITLENFIEDIKSFGFKSFACVVDSNAKPINNVNFGDGSVVLIGNEANGLTAETVKKCDFSVTIPMKGNAESLNASVAGAIAIWEMMK